MLSSQSDPESLPCSGALLPPQVKGGGMSLKIHGGEIFSYRGHGAFSVPREFEIGESSIGDSRLEVEDWTSQACSPIYDLQCWTLQFQISLDLPHQNERRPV